MIKRRERIERWRAERKMKDSEVNKKSSILANITLPSAKKWSLEDDSEDDEDVKEIKLNEGIKQEITETITILDDPIDEPIKIEKMEEEIIEIAKPEPIEIVKPEPIVVLSEPKKIEPEEEIDDDIDPLDAFMQEVDKEVRKINKPSKPFSQTSKSASGGMMIVTGVVKKQTEVKPKGELLEQNQDGLEYSSEEEQEDIKDTAANLANKQKKELAKIDHSTIEYSNFKKNFYVEVPEIAKMTQEEMDLYKSELEGIVVKGKGCPKPIKVISVIFC